MMFENFNWSLFWFFCVLNMVNVIIQTLKTIYTVKGSKLTAAIINAITFSIYTVVVVYTVCELPLFIKCLVVGIVNLIGVYVVKVVEEKVQKDKLWKVEVTINKEDGENLIQLCKDKDLSFNYIDINKAYLLNIYCPKQEDSMMVKELLKGFPVKYFVSETKML